MRRGVYRGYAGAAAVAAALAALCAAPAAAQQARTGAGGDTSRRDADLRPVAVDPDVILRSAPGGATRRREVGYGVAVLDTGDLSTPGVRTLSEALQGRVSGMTVLGAPGFAGVGRDFVLRGAGSWLSSDRPLVFVDGVRVADIPYPAGLSVDQAPDPLDDIDPETVDRVEVVRGPAADAGYGAGDAAGAIYIFTKRGMRGPPVWSVTSDQGTSWLGHVGPDASVDPTGLGLNDCRGTTGCPASGTWLEAGREQRYRASVRGGGDLLGYYLSGHWARETDVIAPQGSRDWSGRGNFDIRPLRSLEIRLEGARAARSTRWVPQDFLSSVLLQDTAWLPGGNDSVLLEIASTQKTGHTTAGASVEWTPIQALPQRITLGLDRAASQSLEVQPAGVPAPAYAERRTQEDWRLRTEMLDYAGAWSQRLGTGAQSSLSWDAQINNLRLDDYTEYVRSDYVGPPSSYTYHADVTTRQLAVRERLALWDRLFVAGAMRWRDATSWDNVGFEAFPAAQVSYLLSGHRFWPRWWESLQLRAAIGWSGQATREATPFSVPVTAVSPGSTAPAILPERVREAELGLRSSMFGGRLALEYTYYDQRTSNALAVIGVSGASGYYRVLENVGTITNRGHEVLADVTVLRTSAVQWQLVARWSNNHSEAGDIGGAFLNGGPVISGPRLEGLGSGEPAPSYWGRVVTNPDAVGVPPVYDYRSLGAVNPSSDYGLTVRVTLGDALTLEALGEGQYGQVLPDGVAWGRVTVGTWPACSGIQDKIVAGDIAGLTAWQQDACAPWNPPAAWTFPAGFFRLRYASLSYRLPDRLGGIGRVWLGVTARNLLLATAYPGLDPEVTTGAPAIDPFNNLYFAAQYAVPQPRSVVLSLRIER